jgi:leucyl-tRNA synthetase
MGGQEHAVGHLLYSRFWHKVFFDMGLVSTKEPFQKLIHQGLIQGEDGEKMSKSRGNVVNPDKVIADYGADTFRLFEMFLGPIEKSKPWQTSSIEGVFRFLNRFWKLAVDIESGQLSSHVVDEPEDKWSDKLRHLHHKTIKVVSEDIERMSYNTAISTFMICLNELQEISPQKIPRDFLKTLTLLMAPLAPHLTEEIWQLLGNRESIARAPWPVFDPKWVQLNEVLVVVQVNGKLRDRVTVPRDMNEDTLKALVLSLETIKERLAGADPKKVIVVPNKLVSIVV